MKVYINGEFKDKDNLGDMFEPGFLFGWGVFEPLRVYAGKIVFLEEHIHRLNNSARMVSLDVPKIDWETVINQSVKENNLSDAYVRLSVYKKRKGTGIIVYADNFAYYGANAYHNGFSSTISIIRRDETDISCKVKTISYLNNRLAWAQAQGKGKDEALMINSRHHLSGGSRSNLFLINDDLIVTPRLEDGAFCGITRQIVMGILSAMDLKIKEKKISVDELMAAQEAFITSSLLEVMPLVSCDDKPIGNGKPGKITTSIHAKYKEKIHG